MHQLIEKLLKKKEINNVSELSTEEKDTYDKWSGILTEEISVDTILTFCRNQIALIESQFANAENSTQKNERLIRSYVILKGLINVITAPKAERTTLEKYLNELLQN